MSFLGRLHDGLTRIGFIGSACALGAITFSYCYEVVARYLFDAPTSWANEFVSYFLSIGVFLMMPHLTRQGGHVAVTLVIELVSPRIAHIMVWIICFFGAVVCAAAAWITADETLRQYIYDIQIMAVNPIDKWIVSIFIPFGLGSSSIYFLRMLNPWDLSARAIYGAEKF